MFEDFLSEELWHRQMSVQPIFGLTTYPLSPSLCLAYVFVLLNKVSAYASVSVCF